MTATFQQFCETTLEVISPEQATRYPLTVLAHAYLQDWYEAHPIDGGVAFEAELRQLPLDGSLASLALLDTFLNTIRPNLAPDRLLLSQTASQRNLLNFIAFYAGAVYAYQVNSPAYWLTYTQITHQFPNLANVIPDDFTYAMAVSRLDLLAETRPFFALNFNQNTFFPLVAMLERLYPKHQPTLPTLANELKTPHSNVTFFGYIAPSLAESVQQLIQHHPSSLSQPLDTTTIETINQVQNPLPAQFDMPLDKGNNRVKQDIFGHARLTHWINNPFIQLPAVSYSYNYLHLPFVPPFIKPFDTNAQTLSNNTLLEMPLMQDVATDVGISTLAIVEDVTLIDNLADNSSQNNPTIIPSTETDSTPPRTTPAKATAKSTLKAQKQALHQAMLARQEAQRQKKVAEALANPTIHPSLLNQSHSMVRADSEENHLATATVEDSFSSLEADLANIPLVNADPTLEQDYQTTRKVLLAVARAIARHRQSQPDTPMVFPEREQKMVEQAIHRLTQQAEHQHTGAMLMLAIYQFRGDSMLGVAQDIDSAMNWLQQAGKLEDNRAEKLLSKLYFSGEIVEQNRLLAEDWLAKSASHGHPEAITLQQQIAVAQTLKSSQREDTVYLQRLMLGIVALLVFLIVVIFTIKT